MVSKLASRLRQPARPISLDDINEAFLAEKVGETLTPNLRALRLALAASDLLLSMGVAANSVVSKALDITEAYCDQPVHINITFNLIMLSQIRGLEDEPLTLIRSVPMRDINNMTVQAVQQLIYEIRTGIHDLSSAEAALDHILTSPKSYPIWVPSIANACIAPAVVLMFSTDWRVIVLSYVLALFVSRLLAALGRWAIAPFFSQVIAGATVTLAAAGMAQLSQHQVQFFAGMNPTLIVVSGIIMLVAGLAFVSAVQDAIEEYYLTATARLMRAIMMTAGIVMGIIIGLYAARKLSIGITVSPNPLQLMQLHYQVIGGAAASAAYALATQTRLRAILWAGLLGGGSLSIMYAATHLGIASVPATGVAATVVGLAAALFSRLWRTPSSGIISVAILPLVPGLTLYTGLMQLVNYPPGHPLFFRGVGTLFTAVATALAIAAGASFGYVLGRPLHRQITHRRNLTPVANFMRRQLHSDRQISKFGRLALRRANRDPERLS